MSANSWPPPMSDDEKDRIKEQLLTVYLSTSAGREKLIQATIHPCEELLLQAKEHPEVFTAHSEFSVRVSNMVKVMDRIIVALAGDENYPKKQFDKLSEDLRALQSALPSSDPL